MPSLLLKEVEGSGGSGVPLNSETLINSFEPKIEIDNMTFLKSGFVETDTTDLDAITWNYGGFSGLLQGATTDLTWVRYKSALSKTGVYISEGKRHETLYDTGVEIFSSMTSADTDGFGNWVAYGDGALKYSLDDGVTWVDSDFNNQYSQYQITCNKLTGTYILESVESNSAHRFYRSYDKGVTFTQYQGGVNATTYIFAPNEVNPYWVTHMRLSSSSYRLAWSSNDGLNWDYLDSLTVPEDVWGYNGKIYYVLSRTVYEVDPITKEVSNYSTMFHNGNMNNAFSPVLFKRRLYFRNGYVQDESGIYLLLDDNSLPETAMSYSFSDGTELYIGTNPLSSGIYKLVPFAGSTEPYSEGNLNQYVRIK
tara:strand:+ start:5844 stop:6941 length:1098 start_codon:yes stop_codon:yes gene_type:complete